MRKPRLTENEIIEFIKEVESGRSIKDVCQAAGISKASYYNWKAKYGRVENMNIKHMKELEDENRRLKQMFIELSLENRTLKDIIDTKVKAEE